MKNSRIDWTDHTFNPWWGCTKVNEGCTNCYAERDSKRYGFDIWGADKPRRTFSEKHWNEPLKWDREAAKMGIRYKVFSASMADVFDEAAPRGELTRLFNLIEKTPHLDWLLLTKRYERAKWWMNGIPGRPWPNVWLVYSASTQPTLDEAAPILRDVDVVVRGISWEPSLGPLDLTKYTDCLDWVIGGDESGAKRRPPADLNWYRSVRDQTQAANIAFFIKQFVGKDGVKIHTPELDGVKWTQYPKPRIEG